MGLFDKLKLGLAKTRNQIAERTMDVISIFKKVDEALFEELEEVLIMSDVGFETSSEIIERLRQKAREEKITEAEKASAFFCYNTIRTNVRLRGISQLVVLCSW